MPIAPPFAVTPEAADFVRSRLRDPEAGRQPCLIRGFGYADALSDVVYFEGEHFQIIYEEKSTASKEQVELLGHQVAVSSHTLQRLANRVLILHIIPQRSGAPKHVLLSL